MYNRKQLWIEIWIFWILIIVLITFIIKTFDWKQLSEMERYQIELDKKTERDIQRCLDNKLWYIKHNAWQISCIPQWTSILNIAK